MTKAELIRAIEEASDDWPILIFGYHRCVETTRVAVNAETKEILIVADAVSHKI